MKAGFPDSILFPMDGPASTGNKPLSGMRHESVMSGQKNRDIPAGIRLEVDIRKFIAQPIFNWSFCLLQKKDV